MRVIVSGSSSEIGTAISDNLLTKGYEVVAFDIEHSWWDSYLQVATAFFSQGKYLGYNIASKTMQTSDQPYLVIDHAGYLHNVWREGLRVRVCTTLRPTPGSGIF